MKAAELLGFGFALAVGETTWFEGLLLIGVYCCSRSPTISVASCPVPPAATTPGDSARRDYRGALPLRASMRR